MCGRRPRRIETDTRVDEALVDVRYYCHGDQAIVSVDPRTVYMHGFIPAELAERLCDPFPLPRLPALLEAPRPARTRGRPLPVMPAGHVTVHLMPPIHDTIQARGEP